MSEFEPRPRFWQRKTQATLVIFVLLIVGGVFYELELQQHYKPWDLLITCFGSMLTVALYELVNLAVQCGVWSRFDRTKFDRFFGQHASIHSCGGLIYLQVDKIDVLFAEYELAHVKDAIDRKPNGRLYKAREWMNYFDTIGAKALLGQFRDYGLDAPLLFPVDRSGDKEEREEQAPFIITMGLGGIARKQAAS